MSEKESWTDPVSLGHKIILSSEQGFANALSTRYNRAYALLQARCTRVMQENEQLKKQLAQYEALSFIDPLTGAYNRRFLDEMGHKIIASEKRAQRSWGILMIDIDHFKNVNDTYGHQSGDHVLQNVTAMLQHISRDGDFVVRYGGEEFLVLVLDISEVDIGNLAERYRMAVLSTDTCCQNHKINVSISIGACFVPCDSAMCFDQVVGYADQQLYRAKDSGRNRVKVFCDRRKSAVSHQWANRRRSVKNE